jgi:hypothetical protein
MTTTMIAPKILEPDRTGSRSAGEGADCFDLVKMFGSRIFRLGKYITGSDADAEAVLVETFLKACTAGSDSGEGMRVRLATIAVREALAKLCYRGRAEAEDNLREDVVIREIFCLGRQPSFARADGRYSRASDVESRSDLPGGIRPPGYRGDSSRRDGARAEPLCTCRGILPFNGTPATSGETGTQLSAG